MRTLVTGAAGYVGSALLQRLQRDCGPGDTIIATDLSFDGTQRLEGIDYRPGGIDDADHRRALVGQPLDQVFHLATVAGVQQSNFALGKRVNLEATMALLDLLAEQEKPSRLVYSSSLGIFGRPFPPEIGDDTLPEPPWSYGVHKLACELLISDYARAGLIDGIAIRFPGIVARPEGSTTILSAFMSNIFYAARDGRAFVLPMAPDDVTWLMSLRCCLDNLLHAANIDASMLPARRAVTLPALTIRMGDLVDALAAAYGDHVHACIQYAPDPAMQKLFATVPLRTPTAEALGMVGDGSPDTLVRNVIAENPELAPLPDAAGA